MAERKAYNSIDSVDRLLREEKHAGKFGGYKQQLLSDILTDLEMEDYVCTECKGVMINACQKGEEQIPVCESCSENGRDVLPTLKTRKRISALNYKCPLYTRGCVWKGKAQEINDHLEKCQEFIIECPNHCGVLITRSEIGYHLSQCQMRIIKCKFCTKEIVFQGLVLHNGKCCEYPMECPNECLATFKRREMNTHKSENCPNTIVNCPYKRFGCEDVKKRKDLGKHKSLNEYRHLDLKSDFALEENAKLNKKISKLETTLQGELSIQVNLRKTVDENTTEIEELKRELGKIRNGLALVKY